MSFVNQVHCYKTLGTACGHGSSDAGMLSIKFSQFNRLHIREESFHVSHCFSSAFDTTLAVNLFMSFYKSRKVFLRLGLSL